MEGISNSVTWHIYHPWKVSEQTLEGINDNELHELHEFLL